MKLMVTGGAGFIGTNLVSQFLESGHEVTVYDNLARRGSNRNLEWLLRKYDATRGLKFIRGDVRDADGVVAAADGADAIIHLAAQVAVTTSVTDPRHDFLVNTFGTLNVLEAARTSASDPIVVFTSTNKVYGGMDDVRIAERETRYEYVDVPYKDGVDENRPLDFHSPYGCSKGAADQYVRDYHRIYGLRTTVFRMSCIYGPHQFGNEDQGWVAHFAIAAMLGLPITIYGDGKQVRDILFVEDLVRAFRLVIEHPDRASGKIYNVGGGIENTISVWREFGPALSEIVGRTVSPSVGDWRPGDQLVYVSNTECIRKDLGWSPTVSVRRGIGRLYQWIKDNQREISTALVPAPA